MGLSLKNGVEAVSMHSIRC